MGGATGACPGDLKDIDNFPKLLAKRILKMGVELTKLEIKTDLYPKITLLQVCIPFLKDFCVIC